MNFDRSQPAEFGVEIKENQPLASLTTIKIGGPAQYFAMVTTIDQLLKLVRWARAVSLPYFILGGGSNILISDEGIEGLVIYNRCRKVRIDQPPCSQSSEDSRPYLFTESGAAMAGVARQSIRAGLTGFEWAVSVPGTVGGAVVGNAGAHGGEVQDTLENALILNGDGEVCEYTIDTFAYAYRDSHLKRLKPLQAAYKPVVLSANFRLAYDDPAQGKARAEQFLQHRRRTQPTEPSLGSIFMNPPNDYAGRLIEAAKLKDVSVGGAEISKIHANFIINPGGVGGATAKDILSLVGSIQNEIQKQFGIQLTPEVQLVGRWK